MKRLNKKMPVILSLTLGLTAALSSYSQAGQEADTGYSLNLLKDCQLVKTLPMTTELITLHQELQQQETLMASLELPINAISAKIDDYSQQIEQLSVLAVQEDENNLHIDKSYLAQQQIAVDALNQLIAEHQQDFDALEQQGHQIGKIAHDFEREMKTVTQGFDYDHIRISSPANDHNATGCEQSAGFL
ncbi:hypothetical protein [Thalassomonas actiniarum]|uniref:Uncharacterized protein n=1 Tax=Thalassomonas actiniarum TaxID=485447 RepID=A0AAE9YVC4_9GAMM|nr:hypothetical protein [Thalassomonas actiniarum]WDE00203.1 hypothetical protein SG35_006000 [Thalassomonas actiniarum]